MGNSFGAGRKRSAKVMKIDGSTFKLKTPTPAHQVLQDHPGHVLLESGEVKQLGLRAKPLDHAQILKPRKVYFLVELPKLPAPAPEKVTRRVQSGINVSAKDRLESLKLSRRAVSDLSSFAGAATVVGEEEGGGVRLRLRLPRSQVTRLVEESRDGTEAAEKIMELCVAGDGGEKGGNGGGAERVNSKAVTVNGRLKSQKRMRFAPIESQIIG